MKKPYFKKRADDPEPLRGMVKRQIRFEEVDMLKIAWHGHYTSFFEDARIQLSDRYGIGYMDLYAHGILAPIKTVHVDFITPLRFKEEITIEGILHYSEASRINSEYIIRNKKGQTAATGYVVQMMLNPDFELFLTQPAFFKKFCDKWKAGKLL
ncbi:MAG: acyl-CoA thioesterase [Proteobacteria bacterium]|nr:acyl-CoA thioesterase [Pseudomonadota bacterium]MBU1581703.1 acyl-CoA thioesterase [Pseudomonadota bacterium]MBU2455446.1 acyl-CoA thioesterase [Pseudomonadota bacterium]MBU2630006.1 acyl-CoA thioesterase [Pseudomonadota bacterium]